MVAVGGWVGPRQARAGGREAKESGGMIAKNLFYLSMILI